MDGMKTPLFITHYFCLTNLRKEHERRLEKNELVKSRAEAWAVKVELATGLEFKAIFRGAC